VDLNHISQWQAVHRIYPSFILDQVIWNLWWTKYHWVRLSPSTSVCPAKCNSTNCSTLIYHPGLVWQAQQWLAYQVDSVSFHILNKKYTLKMKAMLGWDDLACFICSGIYILCYYWHMNSEK
jgi:hypothetical protein